MLLRDKATREQEIKWNRLQLVQIKNKHKICAEVAKNAASAQILCLFFIPTNSNRFYFISCSLVALSLRSIFYFLSTINTFYTVASTKYFFQESDTEKCSLALKHTIYILLVLLSLHCTLVEYNALQSYACKSTSKTKSRALNTLFNMT